MTSECFVIRDNRVVALRAGCTRFSLGCFCAPHQKADGYKLDVRGAGGSFLNSQTAPVV